VPAALAGPIMPARAIKRIRGSERLRFNALSGIVVYACRRARKRLTALPLIFYRESGGTRLLPRRARVLRASDHPI